MYNKHVYVDWAFLYCQQLQIAYIWEGKRGRIWRLRILSLLTNRGGYTASVTLGFILRKSRTMVGSITDDAVLYVCMYVLCGLPSGSEVKNPPAIQETQNCELDP